MMEKVLLNIFILPIRYFNTRETGDIVSRLNDLSYVKELISESTTILLIDLVLVIGSMIVMCIINIKLFLIVILMLGLYGSVVIIYNKWVKYYVIQSQEEEAIEHHLTRNNKRNKYYKKFRY